MQQVIKNAAKVISKAVTQYTGQKFALGRAQEITARLFGFKDYNGLANWLTPEAALAEMSEVERDHAEGADDCSYENEFVIQASSGRFICAPAYPEECSYVRIVDRAGHELAYWTSDEWKEAPEEVMGAILGALKGLGSANLPLLHPVLQGEFAPNARPGADIGSIDLSQVTRVRYNGERYNVESLKENWQAVFGAEKSSILWVKDDTPVIRLFAEEDGLVHEETILAGTLRAMVWDEEKLEFSADGDTFEFWGGHRLLPR